MKEKKRNNKKIKEKDKKGIKEIICSTPFQVVVFLLLLIFVIILGVLIHNKKNMTSYAFDSNMNLALFDIENSFTFGIDALALSKEENDYVIKLTNYKQDNILEEEIPYQLYIENLTDSIISVRKNDSKENLITSQEKTLIDEVMPASSEKEETYFYLHMDSHNKLQAGDFIHVKIIRTIPSEEE